MARVTHSNFGDRANSLIDSEQIERICTMIKAGTFVETAAASAGVGQTTLRKWLKRGREELQRRDHYEDVKAIEAHDDATARTYQIRQDEIERREAREREHLARCEREQIYVDFVQRIDLAVAESEIADLAMINKAAYGGNIVERVVITQNGETREVLKYAAPDWRATQWKMERRHRQNWGKGALEISGPGGKPVEVAATWADIVKDALRREKDRGDDE